MESVHLSVSETEDVFRCFVQPAVQNPKIQFPVETVKKQSRHCTFTIAVPLCPLLFTHYDCCHILLLDQCEL